MSKPLGSGKMLTPRSSYGNVTGEDYVEYSYTLDSAYNAIDAGGSVGSPRRLLNYGKTKPVNSSR